MFNLDHNHDLVLAAINRISIQQLTQKESLFMDHIYNISLTKFFDVSWKSGPHQQNAFRGENISLLERLQFQNQIANVLVPVTRMQFLQGTSRKNHSWNMTSLSFYAFPDSLSSAFLVTLQDTLYRQ
jgi:hypothetical protein